MKVKADTIIRTIVLIVALINQVLTSTGHTIIPISDEQVSEVITLVFTICAAMSAWWKNNSFTRNAIEADMVLDELNSKK